MGEMMAGNGGDGVELKYIILTMGGVVPQKHPSLSGRDITKRVRSTACAVRKDTKRLDEEAIGDIGNMEICCQEGGTKKRSFGTGLFERDSSQIEIAENEQTGSKVELIQYNIIFRG